MPTAITVATSQPLVENPTFPTTNAILFWLVTVVLFMALVNSLMRGRGLQKKISDLEKGQIDSTVQVLKKSLNDFGGKLEGMGREFRVAIGEMTKAYNDQEKDITGIQAACGERHKGLDLRFHGLERKVDAQAKDTAHKVEILHGRISEEIRTHQEVQHR